MSDAITRKEAYLKSIGNGTSSALKPITREEQYLAYIAGETNSFPPKPITREEAFLDKIAKNGVSGGGNGDSLLISLVDGTLTNLYSADIKSIGNYAFYRHPSLITADLPNLTNINAYGFHDGKLENISAPSLETVGDYAFANSKLTRVNLPSLKMTNQASFSGLAVTSVDLPMLETLGHSAFSSCKSLTSISLPSCTAIGAYAFNNCSALINIDLPQVTSIPTSVFQSCGVKHIVFPKVLGVDSGAFGGAILLETVDFHQIVSLYTAFKNCYSLKAIIIRSTTAAYMVNSKLLNGCYHYDGTVNATYNPNGDKDGYIYVPRALMDEYMSKTNWAQYSDRFRAIEDYPEITGG